MTSKPPFDPFEAGDRTVIRPNPGGRRQAQSPQPAPDSAPRSAPRPAPDPAPESAGDDAWLAGSGQHQAFTPPPEPAPPPPPRPAAGVNSTDLEAIRALDVADENPIMRAARPLMVVLSNLRVSGSQQKVAPLMEGVAHSISEFEHDMRQAGVPEDQVVTAKYAMCATADDIVQNIPGSDRNVWTQHSMLSRFFQTRTSGVGFFDELGKVKANPALHYNLLELMHACLSLGFEGQYRTSGGGDVTLQQIRRDLYHTMRHIRPRVGDEIAPHWRGQDIAAVASSARIPVWAVGSIAAAALLGIFVVLRLLLSQSSEVFADQMVNLHPSGEVVLARDVYEPFDVGTIEAESTQLQRIRAALADEIADKRVVVDPAGQNILVRLVNDVLFQSGSADIKDDVRGVLEKVARTLDKEPKNILVVGHTDSVPLRSQVRFKSNHDLSVQRAQSVAAVLRPVLSDSDRLVVEGRGPDDPVANDATAEGRAQNRRVDILLPRTD
jgi:type VI secretion system protein ImpK